MAEDVLFVGSLGIASLVREALHAHSTDALARVADDFGGAPAADLNATASAANAAVCEAVHAPGEGKGITILP